MGIPNIDLYLISLLQAFFGLVKGPGAYVLDDLFAGHAAEEIDSIKLYLATHEVTADIRKQREGQRYLYLLDSYPLADIPFPQVCVTVGDENSVEHFLGDESGTRESIEDGAGNVIAFDDEQVVMSSGTWAIDIMASTKRELVWLSRISQLAILSNLAQLHDVGLMEIDCSVADMRLDPQHFPQTGLARRLTIRGKVRQTWNIRLEAHIYKPGANMALEES